jgi:TonB family protein
MRAFMSMPAAASPAVDILASQPSKVFDRAARRALLRWQFEPNAAGQSSEADVEVKFQRD